MDIVNKVFVINLKNRTDRWNDINKAFDKTGLKLDRWTAVNGNDLSEDKIKQITNKFCNYFCSSSMIGIWLSHYTLWEYIVKNKLDKVLVLEDDAVPVKDFNNKLHKYWKNIPENWDIIFLGCNGSCNTGTLDAVFHEENKKVKDNNNLIVPSFPSGLHAYMISYTGAKKLINEELLKKVKYHIDMYLSMYIFNNNKNINMYAIVPYLIYPNSSASDNRTNTHYLINKIIGGVNLADHYPLSDVLNSQLINFRFLGIPIVFSTIIIFILCILANFIPNNKIRNYTLLTILFYELIEMLYFNTNNTKTKAMGLEIFIILLISLIFFTVRMIK